jgi:hypothetical protein
MAIKDKNRSPTSRDLKGTTASISGDLPQTRFGPTKIQDFLAGCHPPMSHLFEDFLRARITGEIHLQGLARWDDEKLRDYFASNVTQTPLEVEALVQGLTQKQF